MAQITNLDRISALLAQSPGLDDDEITRRLGIGQRQQVNQICRLMESQGKLKRERTVTGGKILNYLSSGNEPVAHKHQYDAVARPQDIVATLRRERRFKPALSSALDLTSDLASTLIILPCSGAKGSLPGQSQNGRSILDSLPEQTAEALISARTLVRNRAGVDESSMMPAWERYQGTLYKSAGAALSEGIKRKLHIIILSGGYGAVLAEEPIGTYNAVFKSSWWPKGLIESVLVNYILKNKLRHVRAFVSATTAYRKVLVKVDWQSAGVEDVVLFTPEPTTGAMVTAPRAQGEALDAFLRGKLTPEWRSRDGLAIDMLSKHDKSSH